MSYFDPPIENFQFVNRRRAFDGTEITSNVSKSLQGSQLVMRKVKRKNKLSNFGGTGNGHSLYDASEDNLSDLGTYRGIPSPAEGKKDKRNKDWPKQSNEQDPADNFRTFSDG